MAGNDDMLLEPAEENKAKDTTQSSVFKAVGNIAGSVATGPYAIAAKLLTNFGVVGIICYLTLQMHNEMIETHRVQVSGLQKQLDRQNELLAEAIKMSDRNNQLLKSLHKEMKEKN